MMCKSGAGHLFYEVSGPKDAPAVIFTHGVAMDHRTFATQTAAFSNRYRVVVWDLPGHGRSALNDAEFGYPLAAACLIDMLDDIGLDAALLVGLSLGGHIDQYAAYYYPERVTAVAEIGSTPLHRGLGAFTKMYYTAFLGISRLIPEKTIAMLFAQSRAVKPATREYLREVAIKTGKNRILQFTHSMLRDASKGIPSPFRQPLLITHGEKDLGLVITQARHWHEDIPGSIYAAIPDAGHIVHQDNPEGFNRVLRRFLEGQLGERGESRGRSLRFSW